MLQLHIFQTRLLVVCYKFDITITARDSTSSSSSDDNVTENNVTTNNVTENNVTANSVTVNNVTAVNVNETADKLEQINLNEPNDQFRLVQHYMCYNFKNI